MTNREKVIKGLNLCLMKEQEAEQPIVHEKNCPKDCQVRNVKVELGHAMEVIE